MKISRFFLGLALLGATASPAFSQDLPPAVLPGVLAKWIENDVGYLANGFPIAEPETWSHDPTVTVSKLAMHGAVTSGPSPLNWKGWSTMTTPTEYVSFTVTPRAGETLVATGLDFVRTFNSTAFTWAYRVDAGSGFGPWVSNNVFEVTENRERWTFPAPLTVTNGAIEIALYATASSTTRAVGIDQFALNGTAGDTTPTVSTPGIISRYTRSVSYPIPVREPSSLTYNWDTGTLFSEGDENDEIVEIDKQGRRLSQMRTNQLNFPDTTYKGDPESLAYLGLDPETGLPLFMIGAERQNISTILRYRRNGDDSPDWMRVTPTITWGPPAGNVGLEGATFDRADATYWGIKEKQPTSLIHATGVGTPSLALTNIDLNDVKWRLGVLDLSDVYVLGNSAAYAGSEHLLLLARRERLIVEITRTGQVVDVLNIANLNQGTIEGITMDDAGTLYLCAESSVSQQDYFFAHGFHVLTPAKTGVSGTGGRQTLAGSAAADEITGNQAADILHGNAGADTYVFRTLRDGVDTILGFTPGEDVLDLSGVVRSVGYKGVNNQYRPLIDGIVRVVDGPSGAVVQVRQGSVHRSLAVLPGLTAAQAGNEANFQFTANRLGN